MSKKVIYNQAKFLLGAAELKQLPEDEGNEVAFIGYSNSGKSSAINTITGIKGLARASKTPGRTQQINIFTLDENNRLADLPGHGYTKAPATVSKAWVEKVDAYLETRKCLRGFVLLMDIRHPLKKHDLHLIDWADQCKLPVHILLTKADKINRGPALDTLKKVQKSMAAHELVTVQLFSAHDNTGLEEAHEKLNEWLMVLL